MLDSFVTMHRLLQNSGRGSGSIFTLDNLVYVFYLIHEKHTHFFAYTALDLVKSKLNLTFLNSVLLSWGRPSLNLFELLCHVFIHEGDLSCT